MLFILHFAALAAVTLVSPGEIQVQSQMAGEVTPSGVILQARIVSAEGPRNPQSAGIECEGHFELWTGETFAQPLKTKSVSSTESNDYFIKVAVDGLTADTRYSYRLVLRTVKGRQYGSIGTFRTLSPDSVQPVSFVVVTGMNYDHFHLGRNGKAANAYTGPDRELGYPALASILDLRPDFFVGTGDNVYYDRLDSHIARTRSEMRAKWHQQFAQARFQELFAIVPTYWEKDDHDYRLNDSDPFNNGAPSHTDGIEVFREQLPVTNPADPQAKTYRTHRLTKHAQIWLPEGRDFRSANGMPDGPTKTLWGAEQERWLRESLLASDATFKIIIHPTPMVGPDDAYKRDNHVNHRGFRREGDDFFAWLKRSKLEDVYVICGDRHWQYHSIHSSGVEEFSCGALVDANARKGRKPGDPASTDPEGLTEQPYIQARASGGFLRVTVEEHDRSPTARFQFFDEQGTLQYEVTRSPTDED
ncbi:MAG: alkaline phosphatase D [Gammaproteobacteria bacterium]|jgi:alkaline phosphatase D